MTLSAVISGESTLAQPSISFSLRRAGTRTRGVAGVLLDQSREAEALSIFRSADPEIGLTSSFPQISLPLSARHPRVVKKWLGRLIDVGVAMVP